MKKWHLRVELSFNKFGDGEHGYGDGNGRGFATGPGHEEGGGGTSGLDTGGGASYPYPPFSPLIPTVDEEP